MWRSGITICWNNALQDTMFYPAYIVKSMVDCWQTGIAFGVMDPLENVSEDQMIQGSFQGNVGSLPMILLKNLLTMCMRCWQKWVPILSKKGKTT